MLDAKTGVVRNTYKPWWKIQPSTKRNTPVQVYQKQNSDTQCSVRMEQQQFSEVEVDKVVVSSNIMEVEESVENSNNTEVDHNQMVGNPEQESCSLPCCRSPGALRTWLHLLLWRTGWPGRLSTSASPSRASTSSSALSSSSSCSRWPGGTGTPTAEKFENLLIMRLILWRIKWLKSLLTFLFVYCFLFVCLNCMRCINCIDDVSVIQCSVGMSDP